MKTEMVIILRTTLLKKATSRLISMAGGIAIGSEATVTEKGENSGLVVQVL